MAEEQTQEEKVKANREELKKRALQRKQKRLQEEKRERLLHWAELIFVICLFGGGFLYYSHRFMKSSMRHLTDMTELGQTVHQVSQLIDNIRLVYATRGVENVGTMKELVDLGAIPSSMLQDDRVVNVYGGDIVIEKSDYLKNVKEAVESPTFKMSYQGLSQKSCVELAMMDWGDQIKGLLAVAIGFVDDKGNDKALNDIDIKFEELKPRRFRDSKGRIRIIQPRRQYQFNVARPQDQFHPTPFSKNDAELGCSCGYEKTCSFAWRYTVFGVDKPVRVDNALAVQQKLKKALEQKSSEKNTNATNKPEVDN